MNFNAPLLALLTCGFGVVSIGAFTLNERSAGTIFGILFVIAAAASVVNVLLTSGQDGSEGELPSGSDMPGEDLVVGHPARGDDVGR
jgi:hypothetical protein